MEKIQSIAVPFEYLDKRLSSIFEGGFWKFKMLFLALALSAGSLLLFNFIYIDVGFRNLFHEMLKPGSVGGIFFDDIIAQGKHPFLAAHHPPGSHEANQAFRLTVPIISWILNLNVTSLYILQMVAGLGFVWVVMTLAFGILQNKTLTFYFITGFTAIYAGANFYINYLGHVDAFPFLFMALVVYLRSAGWVLLFSQLAFWCDERAIINSTFIGLWFLWPFLSQYFKTKTFDRQLVPTGLYALIVSGVLYIVLRSWVGSNFGLSVGHDAALSLQSLWWSVATFGDKATRGLEGMWFVILAAMIMLIQGGQWLKFSLYAFAMGITVLTMLLVADGTRALSFGFVAFFIALKILYDQISGKEIRYLLLTSTMISLMFPISFP